MRRVTIAATVAVVGVFLSWAGQGLWRSSPDALWATLGVVSILSAITIAMHPTISRLLSGRSAPSEVSS